ncbi:MAG: GatB/YqeY domain-containing protein [Desulfovibrionaceae bacterium]
MSLLATLEKDYLEAYKAKEDVKVAVLRMLKTAIKNASIDLRREPDDDEVLELVARQLKQRKESIEQFTKGNRPDLADKERLEMAVLELYMPRQLDDAELVQAIEVAVAETGAADVKDMGRVMQALLSANKGQVDGKKASALVRSRLAR